MNVRHTGSLLLQQTLWIFAVGKTHIPTPDTALPSIGTFILDVVKQQRIVEEKQLDENETVERTLHKCLFAYHWQQPMHANSRVCNGNTPRSFHKACKLPSQANAINKEYNAFGRSRHMEV